MRTSKMDYIRNMDMYFKPRTQSAAYKACLDGILPAEGFIYKSTSIEPLSDTSVDQEELERILGQKNRDLSTNIRLINIFEKMTRNPDKEIALFAAESINAIENDYEKKLESLGKQQNRERAQIHAERAELNKSVPDLYIFYLEEALSEYKKMLIKKSAKISDIIDLCKVLISLNKSSKAKKIIHNENLNTVESCFILARIAYSERDYPELIKTLQELEQKKSQLTDVQYELLSFWTKTYEQ
ncbi:MAG: hypothetical protein PQJ46_09295 [Spirochaetales bacterium]|nr:hypothetical protein [Spirochaetales bacterium]